VVNIRLWRPGSGHVSCHWREPNHNCHHIHPSFRSRPPWLPHMCINRRKSRRKTKPKCGCLRDTFMSPTADQCPMRNLTVDSVHGEIRTSVVGRNNLCRYHLYWPEIHKKVRKCKTPYKTSNPTTSSPVTIKASSDGLHETPRPNPAHSRQSPQDPR